MIEREIYNKGKLVVTTVTGTVRSQQLIDHVFWLIDSHNIGEVQSAYDQVVYAGGVEAVDIREADILRITEIGTALGQGRGRFRTVIIANDPAGLKLANFYKTLAEEFDLEVEVCGGFAEAFAWLGCDNPDPEKYR